MTHNSCFVQERHVPSNAPLQLSAALALSAFSNSTNAMRVLWCESPSKRILDTGPVKDIACVHKAINRHMAASHAPHSVWKNRATSARSTLRQMLAAYTVRLHCSRSSAVRGKNSLLTGTMAVFEGKTRRGYCPSTVPVLLMACMHGA